jgi:hypothetical protein
MDGRRPQGNGGPHGHIVGLRSRPAGERGSDVVSIRPNVSLIGHLEKGLETEKLPTPMMLRVPGLGGGHRFVCLPGTSYPGCPQFRRNSGIMKTSGMTLLSPFAISIMLDVKCRLSQ